MSLKYEEVIRQHEQLAQELGEQATRTNKVVATAESCTGGWVAEAITSVSGSSQWFETGYVTYSNAAKHRMLGVEEETLATVGAVSADVVRQMVKGTCHESGADLAVSVSGIAGPGGGSEEKPVGTVWFAWGNEHHQEAEVHHLKGDRFDIRAQSVVIALEGLVKRLAESSDE